MARILKWQDLIIENMDRKEMEKLNAVNSYFNKIAQVSDLDNYKQQDYWATPLELIALNGGDCEDIAIAKYFTLKKLNVEEKKLWLTYVRAYTKNRIVPHLVLTYYTSPNAEPFILDNIMPDILSASKRKDLKPTYSFNVSGLWAAKERERGKHDGGANRVYKWKDLLERMEDEGF
ncbi:transglutaminase-like cysteine peptidase [Desulfobacterium sp. N47]